MSKLGARLSYANVMATIAVFIALGGTGYAALNLPKNSVGSQQLKPKGVRAGDIATGALTSRTIAESALKGINERKEGPPVANPNPVITARIENTTGKRGARASCLPGELLVGGGGRVGSSLSGNFGLAASYPYKTG